MSTVEKKNSQTLEERLQPWLDQAEYLLIFVIGVMLWSAMFINFLGVAVTSNADSGDVAQRAVLGVIAVLVTTPLWLMPIISLKALERAKGILAYLQRQWWLTLLIFVGFGVLLISMDNRTIWSAYPLVQVCLLIAMAMFTLVVLFMPPYKDAPFQLWRKLGIGLLAFFIAAEILLQGLVFTGGITVDADSGIGISYGRVAALDETVNFSQSNQYGWHYVDYRLEDDERKILLHGDTFVQALQVPLEAHMGQVLEGRINANDTAPVTEVMGQGLPGYGPGMYLNDNLTAYIWEPLAPDEVIVFYHLVNDFQIETALEDRVAILELTDDPTNRVVIRDDAWKLYHDTSHDVIAGHDPLNPFEIMLSYSMLWNLLQTPSEGRLANQPLHMDQVSDAQPFGAATVLYETDGDAEITTNTYALTEALLADYVDVMRAADVEIHLVTIPYFPAAFYESKSGNDWDATLGDYDMTLPEAELRAMAAALDIEFLGMLDYLQGTDTETLQSYFFEQGTGHLTTAGHQAFAEAVYSCFYGDVDVSRCGAED